MHERRPLGLARCHIANYVALHGAQDMANESMKVAGAGASEGKWGLIIDHAVQKGWRQNGRDFRGSPRPTGQS